MLIGIAVAWGADPAVQEEPAAGARFVVVADDGATRAELLGSELRWGDEGLFRVDGWPRVVDAASLGVDDPAAALFVAAEVRDAAVADRLVKYLTGRGFPARAVVAPGTAPDLRVLWVDTLSVSGNGAPLFAYDVCLLDGSSAPPAAPTRRRREPSGPACLARARPSSQFGSWFIVYPASNAELIVWADAGEPWQCRTEAVGRAPDRPVWLHGPVAVTCLAPPVEVPSR